MADKADRDAAAEQYRNDLREALRDLRQALAKLTDEQSRQATQLTALVSQISERCPHRYAELNELDGKVDVLEKEKNKMMGILSVIGLVATSIFGLVILWIEKQIKGQ